MFGDEIKYKCRLWEEDVVTEEEVEVKYHHIVQYAAKTLGI